MTLHQSPSLSFAKPSIACTPSLGPPFPPTSQQYPVPSAHVQAPATKPAIQARSAASEVIRVSGPSSVQGAVRLVLGESCQ